MSLQSSLSHSFAMVLDAPFPILVARGAVRLWEGGLGGYPEDASGAPLYPYSMSVNTIASGSHGMVIIPSVPVEE